MPYKIPPIAFVLLLTAGCALNPFEGPYHPPGAPLAAEGPADIALAQTIDGADPAQAAAVRQAATQALAGRNLAAGGGPDSARLVMHLAVRQWTISADGGHVALAMSLIDRETGRQLYTGQAVAANTVNTVALNPGTLPANQGLLLQEAMGKLLSRQAFINASAAPKGFLFF